MAHEIAHLLDRYEVGSTSLQRLSLPLVLIINHVFDLRFLSSKFVTPFLSLPYTRRLEHGSYILGLLIETEACFNPREAFKVFDRLESLQNEKRRAKRLKNTLVQVYSSTHIRTCEVACGISIRSIRGVQQPIFLPASEFG